LELALWIIKLNRLPVVDLLDNDGMRAIDLLAFKVDDDHKKFIKESPLFEKNYKIKKVFQAYSWGRSDDFLLGYPTLKEEQTEPRLIAFLTPQEQPIHGISIRDVHCTDSYSVALSEQGDVFTWGCGSMGRLGNRSEDTQIYPYQVCFDFKDEQKKIKKT
jgi:alpha-tubulin suppressor-like RCC1 family protein